MKSIVLTASLLLALTGADARAEKGPHPAVKTKNLDGVGTCQGKNVIGNFVFSLSAISFKEKSPKGLVAELEFAQGHPPAKWFGRSYFACTQGEAIGGIEGKSRGHQVRTRISWGDRPDEAVSILSDVTTESKGWNTLSFTGDQINHKLSAMSAGRHKLFFARHLEFEVPVVQVGGGVKWEGRFIVLADGTLELVVK